MGRKTTKMVREGDYAAEVEVKLVGDKTGWSPYFAPEEAEKLDQLRRALAAGDLGPVNTN
ncbi:MAG: hypothetical protein JAZ15_21215 [Candidatus Thiodiazotropha endolucinida]|nr:hypothetical protein [Candidatus Thiodiazotropha taylori]MCW4345448.1 hypothetical protein [Candidatus Thiodiazotropha endolucinida]MCG8047707.1 hypothetical protein [Candidatus Thiodiazotropha taylori]MCG8053719.1 hypothetical protein [Candidatus Thiodiazotropha taylori]MCW4315539.1 hypothetical protein [Candidatus Thiodiazotropha taylori]